MSEIARALSRARPHESIQAECLKQLVALSAAGLVVSLLLINYGVDLSPALF